MSLNESLAVYLRMVYLESFLCLLLAIYVTQLRSSATVQMLQWPVNIIYCFLLCAERNMYWDFEVLVEIVCREWYFKYISFISL